MRIGVAKEIKPDEYRVALTPAGALELTRRGHDVVVETGAGAGSAYPDDAYERVGARIGSVDEVWESTEMVLKVKEPIASEYGRLREELILFTYLHIAADEPLAQARVLLGQRLLDLQHQLCLDPDLLHARDSRADRAVGVVGERAAPARAGLDDHVVTALDELARAGRREGDAVLVRLDLLGDADPHAVETLDDPPTPPAHQTCNPGEAA